MISSKPLKERAMTLKTSMNCELEEAPLRGGASEAIPDRSPNQRLSPNHRNSVHAVGKANTLGTNAQQRKLRAIAATERAISAHNAFPSQLQNSQVKAMWIQHSWIQCHL